MLSAARHIMLSYSRKAEPRLTAEVKRRLIEQGHQVWIDTEHISQGLNPYPPPLVPPHYLYTQTSVQHKQSYCVLNTILQVESFQ